MSFETPFRLRVLHFNDLHGRLVDFDGGEIRPRFSRIARYVAEARAECAGRSDCGVVCFSGGDDLVGSPFAELAGTRLNSFRVHPAYRAYSAAGIDAGAIGNHDLDWGLEMVGRAAAADARFPLLSANLAPRLNHESPGIRRATILSVNGARVGVTGLTTPNEIKPSPRGKFVLAEPVESTLTVARELRPHCDALILLSHLGHSAAEAPDLVGRTGDLELAATLPRGAVDLIVGAHTHSVLNRDGVEAINTVNGITIAQAGAFGHWLGDVTLEITASGAVVSAARLLAVDDLPPWPEFDAAYIWPAALETQELMREQLGALDPIGERYDELFTGRESALGNFVADALVARCRAAGLEVDFALVDSSLIAECLPVARELTYGDLFRVVPFADSVAIRLLPPAQLPALLLDNARRATFGRNAGEATGFAHFSRGLRYAIDRSAPPPAPVALDMRLESQDVHAMARERTEPIAIACGTFARRPAAMWERRQAAEGHEVFDIGGLPALPTDLAVRAEAAAYIREAGGITEAAGFRYDGRVRVL
jgi:2',3'-cyclic-nucleotide 2'-phosphodiesterase (5'-nucleotidase family)